MNLNDLFPLMYYTNMSYRPDRNIQAQAEFAKLGISPIRIEGEIYNGTPDKVFNGYIGCGFTHLKCLKLAREQNENLLMFEDDVVFINDYMNIISRALEELPEWDMFYLGGNICSTIYQVSTHLGKLTHSQSTHAYGVNKEFLDQLISIIEPRCRNEIIDVVYGNEVIPNNNSYITIPMVAIQREGFSDIENKTLNYNWMEERFYNNLVRRG